MIAALALMLQAAPVLPALPHYDSLPNYSRRDIGSCTREFERLESFVSRFKRAVFNREIGRGGKLEWQDANNIRYAADVHARPYMEGIRKIAFQGRVAECRRIADDGIAKVTDEVIRPVFGR